MVLVILGGVGGGGGVGCWGAFVGHLSQISGIRLYDVRESCRLEKEDNPRASASFICGVIVSNGRGGRPTVIVFSG